MDEDMCVTRQGALGLLVQAGREGEGGCGAGAVYLQGVC